MADRDSPDLLPAPAPAADGASAIAPPRRARRAAAPVPGSLAEPKDDDDEDDFDNEDYDDEDYYEDDCDDDDDDDDWPPAAAAAWFDAAARRADYAGEEDDAEPGPAELEPRAALAAAAAAAVRRGGGARGASDGEDHNSLGAAARKPPAGTYDLDADMLLLPAGGGGAAAAATAAAPAAAPAVAAAPAFRIDSCEAMLSKLAATRLPATVLPEVIERHIANPPRRGPCAPLGPTAAAKLREFCRRGGNVEHERAKSTPHNRFVVSVPAHARSDKSGKIVPVVSKAIYGWANLDRWAAGELTSMDIKSAKRSAATRGIPGAHLQMVYVSSFRRMLAKDTTKRQRDAAALAICELAADVLDVAPEYANVLPPPPKTKHDPDAALDWLVGAPRGLLARATGVFMDTPAFFDAAALGPAWATKCGGKEKADDADYSLGEKIAIFKRGGDAAALAQYRADWAASHTGKKKGVVKPKTRVELLPLPRGGPPRSSAAAAAAAPRPTHAGSAQEAKAATATGGKRPAAAVAAAAAAASPARGQTQKKAAASPPAAKKQRAARGGAEAAQEAEEQDQDDEEEQQDGAAAYEDDDDTAGANSRSTEDEAVVPPPTQKKKKQQRRRASAAAAAAAAAAARPKPPPGGKNNAKAVPFRARYDDLISGLSLPPRLCRTDGDRPVTEYTRETFGADEAFEIERIVASRDMRQRRASDGLAAKAPTRYVLVKWKGFELDVGDPGVPGERGGNGGWERLEALRAGGGRAAADDAWSEFERGGGREEVEGAAEKLEGGPCPEGSVAWLQPMPAPPGKKKKGTGGK